MIKIEHVVCPSDDQMMFVIEGMRNAFNSWDKSDSAMHSCTDTGVETGFHLGEVDNALMCKLARLGSDERKFMRQMPIMMRITAPLYWWKEFDTYKVGTVSNSCSTMHTIADREFQWEDFSIEYLRYEKFGTIEDAQNKMRDDAITQFENTRNTLNAYRHQYLKAKKKGKEDLAKDYWGQIIQLLPSSYNQTRNVSMNYEVLANIYKARRAHKLREWRDFCEVIRTLPYFNVIEASLALAPRENSKASNEETQIFIGGIVMSEFCFNVKQEILTKNIEEFAKRAAKYGVRYTVQPLAFDEARVSLEGSCNSKIALLTGILTRKEDE